jgi:hypothetical protein
MKVVSMQEKELNIFTNDKVTKFILKGYRV